MNLRRLSSALWRGVRFMARLPGLAMRGLYRTLPDRWDVIPLSGAGLLGGGVWGQWGPSWACMLWGVLLLGVAILHAVRLAHVEGGR